MTESPEKLWAWLWGYRRWLFGIALKDYRNIIKADQNRAADLVDDVLVRAAQKIDDLSDRRKVRGWLRKILKHAAVDMDRAEKKEGKGFAHWLRSVCEKGDTDDSFRYFAFLSLIELGATKAEK